MLFWEFQLYNMIVSFKNFFDLVKDIYSGLNPLEIVPIFLLLISS